MKNITDYIKVYKNALSVKFCENLILKASIDEDDWLDAKAVTGRNHYRSAKFFTAIDREYKTKKGKVYNFDPMLFKTIVGILKLYQDSFNGLKITSDEGYQLLRYCAGDYHIEHVDNCVDSKPRTLSILIMCNKGFKGGDLVFRGDHIVQMGVGDALIFPSNFMFPHQVTPVTDGVRYTISSFCN